MSGHLVVQHWDWNMGKNMEYWPGPLLHLWLPRRRGEELSNRHHETMLVFFTTLTSSSLHMSETSGSSVSGSFKASSVTVIKLAFERASMAECIMGSHTSSMFGITNIF